MVGRLEWCTAWLQGPAAKLVTPLGVFLVFPYRGRWRVARPGIRSGVTFAEQADAMAYVEDYYRARAAS
jgi:hypothetical protein